MHGGYSGIGYIAQVLLISQIREGIVTHGIFNVVHYGVVFEVPFSNLIIVIAGVV